MSPRFLSKSAALRRTRRPILLFLMPLLFQAPTNASQVTFTYTGMMTTARSGPTATLLNNGKVLVVGGTSDLNTLLASAELYDPATGTFSATGSMSTARSLQTATLLPSGKVLVCGGVLAANGSGTEASAELYDPATGTFSPTGNLITPRSNHTATLLPNGKVLIAGGANGSVALNSAELYDPSTGVFTATGSMNQEHVAHTATLLNNGKVLIAGGYNAGWVTTATAELYDPTMGLFTLTGNMTAAVAFHTATLLNDSTVLIAGGMSEPYQGPFPWTTSAELYDPSRSVFTPTGSLNTSRANAAAVLMGTGEVLIMGGSNEFNSMATTELYDSTTHGFTVTGSMESPRSFAAATVLPNQQVLIIGGTYPVSSTTELGTISPGPAPSCTASTVKIDSSLSKGVVSASIDQTGACQYILTIQNNKHFWTNFEITTHGSASMTPLAPAEDVNLYATYHILPPMGSVSYTLSVSKPLDFVSILCDPSVDDGPNAYTANAIQGILTLVSFYIPLIDSTPSLIIENYQAILEAFAKMPDLQAAYSALASNPIQFLTAVNSLGKFAFNVAEVDSLGSLIVMLEVNIGQDVINEALSKILKPWTLLSVYVNSFGNIWSALSGYTAGSVSLTAQ